MSSNRQEYDPSSSEENQHQATLSVRISSSSSSSSSSSVEVIHFSDVFESSINFVSMNDTTVCSPTTGISYNRDEIEKWLRTDKRYRDPRNMAVPLHPQQLIPNYAIRSWVAVFTKAKAQENDSKILECYQKAALFYRDALFQCSQILQQEIEAYETQIDQASRKYYALQQASYLKPFSHHANFYSLAEASLNQIYVGRETWDDNRLLSNNFLCPLTLAIFKEPMITPQGITYEKAAIEQWLAVYPYDPFTQVPLSKDQLIANISLRDGIQNLKTSPGALKIEVDEDHHRIIPSSQTFFNHCEQALNLFQKHALYFSNILEKIVELKKRLRVWDEKIAEENSRRARKKLEIAGAAVVFVGMSLNWAYRFCSESENQEETDTSAATSSNALMTCAHNLTQTHSELKVGFACAALHYTVDGFLNSLTSATYAIKQALGEQVIDRIFTDKPKWLLSRIVDEMRSACITVDIQEYDKIIWYLAEQGQIENLLKLLYDKVDYGEIRFTYTRDIDIRHGVDKVFQKCIHEDRLDILGNIIYACPPNRLYSPWRISCPKESFDPHYLYQAIGKGRIAIIKKLSFLSIHKEFNPQVCLDHALLNQDPINILSHLIKLGIMPVKDDSLLPFLAQLSIEARLIYYHVLILNGVYDRAHLVRYYRDYIDNIHQRFLKNNHVASDELQLLFREDGQLLMQTIRAEHAISKDLISVQDIAVFLQAQSRLHPAQAIFKQDDLIKNIAQTAAQDEIVIEKPESVDSYFMALIQLQKNNGRAFYLDALQYLYKNNLIQPESVLFALILTHFPSARMNNHENGEKEGVTFIGEMVQRVALSPNLQAMYFYLRALIIEHDFFLIAIQAGWKFDAIQSLMVLLNRYTSYKMPQSLSIRCLYLAIERHELELTIFVANQMEGKGFNGRVYTGFYAIDYGELLLQPQEAQQAIKYFSIMARWDSRSDNNTLAHGLKYDFKSGYLQFLALKTDEKNIGVVKTLLTTLTQYFMPIWHETEQYLKGKDYEIVLQDKDYEIILAAQELTQMQGIVNVSMLLHRQDRLLNSYRGVNHYLEMEKTPRISFYLFKYFFKNRTKRLAKLILEKSDLIFSEACSYGKTLLMTQLSEIRYFSNLSIVATEHLSSAITGKSYYLSSAITGTRYYDTVEEAYEDSCESFAINFYVALYVGVLSERDLHQLLVAILSNTYIDNLADKIRVLNLVIGSCPQPRQLIQLALQVLKELKEDQLQLLPNSQAFLNIARDHQLMPKNLNAFHEQLILIGSELYYVPYDVESWESSDAIKIKIDDFLQFNAALQAIQKNKNESYSRNSKMHFSYFKRSLKLLREDYSPDWVVTEKTGWSIIHLSPQAMKKLVNEHAQLLPRDSAAVLTQYLKLQLQRFNHTSLASEGLFSRQTALLDTANHTTVALKPTP